MATRAFERRTDVTNMYWTITIDGPRMIVSWGRFGSLGHTKEFTFASRKVAAQKAEKLIAAKTLEGYREVARRARGDRSSKSRTRSPSKRSSRSSSKRGSKSVRTSKSGTKKATTRSKRRSSKRKPTSEDSPGPGEDTAMLERRSGLRKLDSEDAVQLLASGSSGVATWNRLRKLGRATPALRNAHLGLNRNLRGIDLADTDVTGASLIKVHLQRARFDGAETSGAVFGHSVLTGATYENARSRKAVFNYAKGVEISFAGADLTSSRIIGVSFRRCSFRGARLRGAHLYDSDLSQSDFSNADVSNANASRSNFTNANLRGANLSSSDLRDAVFKGANLSSATLRNVNAYGAVLTSASFKGANCRSADFRNADLSASDLRGADLSSARMKGATLTAALLDAQTILRRTDIAEAELRQMVGASRAQTYVREVGPSKSRRPPPLKPRPFEPARIVPSLAKRRIDTTLLRSVRRGPLPRMTSKIGGKLFWPANEPWPFCQRHQDHFVGVLQLMGRDFQHLPLPSGADMFQLLWCTHYSSRGDFHPRMIFRSANATDLLEDVPLPRNAENVPRHCRLFGEPTVEYPPLEELSASELRALGDLQSDYENAASVAWSSKIGGYAAWVQSSAVPRCKCGKHMKHYLTLACAERMDGQERWGSEQTGLWMLGGGACYVFVCQRCRPWRLQSVVQV